MSFTTCDLFTIYAVLLYATCILLSKMYITSRTSYGTQHIHIRCHLCHGSPHTRGSQQYQLVSSSSTNHKVRTYNLRCRCFIFIVLRNTPNAAKSTAGRVSMSFVQIRERDFADHLSKDNFFHLLDSKGPVNEMNNNSVVWNKNVCIGGFRRSSFYSIFCFLASTLLTSFPKVVSEHPT